MANKDRIHRDKLIALNLNDKITFIHIAGFPRNKNTFFSRNKCSLFTEIKVSHKTNVILHVWLTLYRTGSFCSYIFIIFTVSHDINTQL